VSSCVLVQTPERLSNTQSDHVLFLFSTSEISRDLVADVCVASITDKKASNKVLEIIEDEDTPPKVFNGLNM